MDGRETKGQKERGVGEKKIETWMRMREIWVRERYKERQGWEIERKRDGGGEKVRKRDRGGRVKES